MQRKFFSPEWGNEGEEQAMTVAKDSAEEVRCGFLPKEAVVWVSKWIAEAALIASKSEQAMMHEILEDKLYMVSVTVIENLRGRYFEPKIPSCQIACIDVLLKIPEEDGSSGCKAFARKMIEILRK